MQWRMHALLCLLTLTVPVVARGQQPQPSSNPAPAKAPAKKPPAAQSAPKPEGAPEAQAPQTATLDPDAELQVAVQTAGNDPAKLVQNLEAFLVRYPDSPRRVAIYRALVQSEMQAHNEKLALDYAEKVIAIQGDDIQTMFLAATILEKMPDDASRTHSIDYATRLIGLVAKADPESRPQQMSLDDWQAGRNKFTMNLYVLRGRTERDLHKDDEAVKDFTSGFRLLPSAEAALNLGEIAEQQKHSDEAIRQYALTFFLTGLDPDDNSVDRDTLRLKMGNLWRFSHDSNAGLGDVLLAGYDKDKALAAADRPDAVAHNPGVTDPLQFAMRRVDGNGAVKMAETHGKVVILNFWTTWCAYCRTMEPMLADVRKKFASRDDVVSMTVNTDEEEGLVAPFLKEQKLDGTLVFSDGLDQAFHVVSIPTIIVLDRAGKIGYRSQGFAPDGFVDAIASAITKASAAPAPKTLFPRIDFTV
jgi:thiol-disulfide isomerase/thioredoxin